MSNVSFEIAEVVSGYNNTYTNPDENAKENIKPYSIRVRIINTTNSRDRNTRTAIPYDINNVQIPLLGEQVLLIQGHKGSSKHDDFSNQWYYISSFSSNSSSNINSIVSISDQPLTEQQIELKRKNYKEITEKTISLLQLYPGDRVLSGRWGNTIRLGSTTNFNDNVIPPVLLGNDDTVGDPLIILSNTNENNQDRQFINENINSDYSSLYLTSTQKLSKFVLNNKLNIGTSESDYNGSQFIGVSDRIILHAKTDIVALDSQTGIEINSPSINFGITDNKEAMLYGGVVKEILEKLVDMVSIGFAGESGEACTAIYDQEFGPLFKQLENENIMFDKHPERL